ncbi:HEAT repeat domain-containing protein [Geitlerinema sp. P-1104]|uniref:HEAT repeat domain-containing protein n=1 Tax=Geitlerinema sp. P-1104 TaxID=2546230 RepID=UPI001477099A|nr:HEAT repeat domain-containing protein [Geitlerinema sp. P-1104]NMG57539.1 HEAT repeat domain-containing protein [Geitlerinema sp. P-1104]
MISPWFVITLRRHSVRSRSLLSGSGFVLGMLALGQVPAFPQAVAELDCHSRPALSAYLLSDTARPNYPLIRQCGPGVIPHLIHLLETETTATNRTLGNRITQAVSRFGPDAALPLLAVAQTSQNETARFLALRDLLEENVVWQIALDAYASELWMMPSYHSEGHRLAYRIDLLTTLMEGLGHLASSDPSPQIRIAALRPLGDIAFELELRPQVAAVGVAQLQHPDPEVRSAAAMMLAEAFYRADPEAVTLVVPALIEVFVDDPEYRPRIAAAGALGFIGPSAAAAVPTLLAAFAEDEEMESAGLALAQIATPEARAAIPLLVERFHQEESVRWANALVRIGADQEIAIPALLRVLATPLSQNPYVGMGFREQAAQLLIPLGIGADQETALALRQELMWIGSMDPENRVQRAARMVQERIEQGNPHLVSAGRADAPTQTTDIPEQSRDEVPRPWAELQSRDLEQPLLGGEYNRIMGLMWSEVNDQSNARSHAITIACDALSRDMAYLRGRVPRQIEDAYRQMAPFQTKALSETLPASAGRQSTAVFDEMEAETLLELIRSGDDYTYIEYEQLLSYLVGLDLATYLDPAQDDVPLSRAEFLAYLEILYHTLQDPGGQLGQAEEFLREADRLIQELLTMLQEVRRSLALLESTQGSSGGNLTTLGLLPTTKGNLSQGSFSEAIAPRSPQPMAQFIPLLAIAIADEAPVTRRDFLLAMLNLMQDLMAPFLLPSSLLPLNQCGNYRVGGFVDPAEEMQSEVWNLMQPLYSLNLEILALVRNQTR